MNTLKALLFNALVGLVILFVANAVALGVEISVLTLLICAIFGIPGALLVIGLSFFDIAFMAVLALLVFP